MGGVVFGEMPFAEVGGGIARFFQDLGYEGVFFTKKPAVFGGDEFSVFCVSSFRRSDGVDAVALGPLTRHEAAAGGSTVGRGGIAVGKSDT